MPHHQKADEYGSSQPRHPNERVGHGKIVRLIFLGSRCRNDELAILFSFRALLLALLESGDGSASHRAPGLCEELHRP
jgi:hypothetical protein